MKYFFLILGIVLLFFYPIFSGRIPFPGDLLVSVYEPYRAYTVGTFQTGSAVPSKLQGSDVVRHIFPWKYFAINSFKKGEIPFWNPHNFSGNPLMGNFQSAVFYPINLIFFVLPFYAAWTFYILSIPLLSSFFMYLFLREIKLSNLSSIFGGTVFAFSSYMTVWMEWGNVGHTFLWLPLCLFFVEKLIKKIEIKHYVLLVLSLTASLLAGYIQIYFYIVATLFVYFLFKTLVLKSFTVNKLILFLTSLIFPLTFTLFQILPTIDLFSESSRGSYSTNQIQNLLNPWWYLITAIAPNFFGNPATNNHWFDGTFIERVSYIGLIPFILFLSAILNYKKRIETRIFGVLGIFTLFISTDLLITKYFFTIPFPIISTTVPTRILSLFQFSAAVLAAIGLEHLKESTNWKREKYLKLSFGFIFILLFSSWTFTFLGRNFGLDSLDVTRKNLVIPTTLFILFFFLVYFWFRTRSKILILAILAFTILDLFYFFHRMTPFSPKEFIYPKTPIIDFIKENAGINRFWGYGSGYVESDFQTFDGTFSPDGVDPLHIRNYTRLLESAKSGEFAAYLPRPDAVIPKGYGTEDLKSNFYRQRILNLLGVKYILHKTDSEKPDHETFPESLFTLVYKDGKYNAYENKNALPRVFLAANYVVEPNEEKVIDYLYDRNFDIKKTIVLEEKIANMEFLQDPDSESKVIKYGNNEVLVNTVAKGNMILFLSDTYSSSWKAYVDGKEKKIYRANLAFRAIPLEAGRHEVLFKYESASFQRGTMLSLVSFTIFLLGILLAKRYEKV